MSKRITVTREVEATVRESIVIEVPDDFFHLGNPYLDEHFDPWDHTVITEEEAEIEETHEWGSWEVASVVEPEKVEAGITLPTMTADEVGEGFQKQITWETIVQSWDSPAEEFVTPTIKDGMTAEGVWVVINDILDSVFHAADAKAFNEVRDYVGNVYGEEEE